MWRAWRHPSAPSRWQTIPVYTAVFLFAYLAVFKAGFGYVRSHIVEPFRIPSQSMAPGIVRGDFLFADKRVNCPGCRHETAPGDVALFVFPDNRGMVFIKRVIGMPGDTIEIDGAAVRRNGKPLTVRSTDMPDGGVTVVERGAHGEYEVQWDRADGGSRTFEVPHGHVFVMGDNRSHSRDSRSVGTIPLTDVIGVARSVWLSLDNDMEIRWERMGRRVH
jgi:signal peptidase I